jgi:hypothetical protein
MGRRDHRPGCRGNGSIAQPGPKATNGYCGIVPAYWGSSGISYEFLESLLNKVL